MAGLATLGEAAMVRIAVTIGTLAKGDAGITGLVVGPGRVTLLASHLGVQSGQRVARFGVVELADSHGLPVIVGVALEAVRTQASLVLVLVTGDAVLGNTQKGPIQVLDLDLRALGRRHVLRTVALVASQTRVLAFERVSGLLVIEAIRVPLDEGKILPVVLGVAAHAFLAGPRGDVIGGVQALVRRQARSNLRVAIQTPEIS